MKRSLPSSCRLACTTYNNVESNQRQTILLFIAFYDCKGTTHKYGGKRELCLPAGPSYMTMISSLAADALGGGSRSACGTEAKLKPTKLTPCFCFLVFILFFFRIRCFKIAANENRQVT